MTTTIKTNSLNLQVGDVYLVNQYVWIITKLKREEPHIRYSVWFYELFSGEIFRLEVLGVQKYPPISYLVYRNGKRLEW